MCGCTGNENLAASPSRAIILRLPAVVKGEPRSETNTKGDSIDSRLSRRRARNSTPDSGCVEGSPFFARFTWMRALAKSMLSQDERLVHRHRGALTNRVLGSSHRGRSGSEEERD